MLAVGTGRQTNNVWHKRGLGVRNALGAAVRVSLLAAVLVLTLGTHAQATPHSLKAREGAANETPEQLVDVTIEQRLGEKIDLDAKFVDHTGKEVTLREYTKGGKPLLLSLAYYSCPSLCNFHLNGLNDAFKQMQKPLGEEFNLVVLSFDPKEKHELAAAKRESYITEYGRPEGAAGWHFLTGEAQAIEPLAKAVGFSYKWDEEQKQYAHAAAAYAISPDGTISRYMFGIVFDPNTIRLSMLEASKGQVGSLVDKLILYCFHYDPKANKYTLAAFNVMRAGGVLILLVLIAFFVPFWMRARKETAREETEGDAR
jgi:protein SCO1/2